MNENKKLKKWIITTLRTTTAYYNVLAKAESDYREHKAQALWLDFIKHLKEGK